MNKRIMTLMAALVMVLLMVFTTAFAVDDTPSDSAGYYYVYTENGKGLNVRATPGGEVVGSLKYGTKIYCYYRDGGNGWAMIDYTYNMPGVGKGTYACFISSRYLRSSKPPAKPDGATPTPAAQTDPEAELNAEFRSARKVDPFVVTVRPSRASGWVNLRWAPSKQTEVMATYKANEKLLVIQELKNWYQVEDQDTGNVGFISKQFVVK